MDPNNPVVKLCVQGMQAETEGRYENARTIFAKAWESSTDDFEACIAAHYLARHQDGSEETLRWNQEALRRAEAVGDERVNGFYPSLYLNLGYSYELLGNRAEARKYYDLAASKSDELPGDAYSQVVRRGIAEGLERLSRSSKIPASENYHPISKLTKEE